MNHLTSLRGYWTAWWQHTRADVLSSLHNFVWHLSWPQNQSLSCVSRALYLMRCQWDWHAKLSRRSETGAVLIRFCMVSYCTHCNALSYSSRITCGSYGWCRRWSRCAIILVLTHSIPPNRASTLLQRQYVSLLGGILLIFLWFENISRILLQWEYELM